METWTAWGGLSEIVNGQWHHPMDNYFDCMSCPNVGWAVPTTTGSELVGTAHLTGSHTVELLT